MGETEKSGITKTDRLTGAALDVVSVEAATLEGEGKTEIIAEAEVHEGEVVTTKPPPTKTDRDSRVEVRTVGTEVGCHNEQLIGGMGKAGHVG